MLVLAGLFGASTPAIGQNVTPASGGENISADNAATGTFVTLTGPAIQETTPGQLSSGNIRLRVPSGFVFDTGGGDPTITVTHPKGNRITVTLVSRSSTEIVFSLDGNSQGPPPNNPHRIEFGDIRVRPSQGNPLPSGEIRNVGSAAPGGTTNYGTLSTVAGSDDQIFVETAADGSGNEVGARELQAGNSLTVFSIVRDQFDNFKRNESVNWSLVNQTGGVDSGDLAAAGDGLSATMTGELVGSAEIQGNLPDITAGRSGVITVVHGIADQMLITTQPSPTATAGSAFDTQPALQIEDEFGNVVTDNSSTQVTATINSGEGTLQGTTQQTADQGIVTFADLFSTTADTIDLAFESDNVALNIPVSNSIIVSPAAADSLTFVTQPSNVNKSTDLTPPIEVRILDNFENPVAQSGTSVTLSVASGPGSISPSSTNPVNTDSEGIASFDDIQISTSGQYTLQASASGLADSEVSNSFTVADAGKLAGFDVEITGGGNIGTQTAGSSFDLRITAVDGTGSVLDGTMGKDNFTGTVELSTSSLFSDGTDSTGVGPFVDGVFDPHPVTLLRSQNDATITATLTDSTINGSSNPFDVNAAAPDPDSSLIAVSRDTLIADGASESVVTVTLVDEFGNKLGSGGDNVDISIGSGGGSLSSVTDNGDGTYQATLTASNDVGSATLTATVNSQSITSGDPIVVFTFGELTQFSVEETGGGNITTQTAGVPFNLEIRALDNFNNVVETFTGSGATVEISSTGPLTDGSGTSPAFTDGILSSLTVEFEVSGTYTITARRTGFNESGTSNSFSVNPAGPDETASTISAGRNFLQNDGADNTTVTVQLKDEFGNDLIRDGDNVSLSTTAGSLSPTSGTTTDGAFTSTITAGTAVETGTVTASVNGNALAAELDITITEFNEWTGDAGGNPSNQTDWENADNWTLGSLPATGEVVQIPSGLSSYPVLDESSPTLDIINIEAGANVTMDGQTITINNEITGDGSFFGNNGVVNILGDVNLANFIAGSSVINITGSSEQSISGDFTADTLNIQQNTTGNDYMEAFSLINIESGNTLTMGPGSQMVAFDEVQIDGMLVGNGSSFRFGGDVTGTNISLTDTDVTFNGTTPQEVNGMSEIRDLTISNAAGVTVQNDLTVTDTLTISTGKLTIASGFSFASNVKEGNTSNLEMLREITSPPGWRMISPPLDATYQNLFDSTITQGYPGADYYDASNPDSLQPNVLWYDETFPGTDNQRWRAPSDASNNVTPGRGLFVFFFGSEPGDSRYNNPLPDTLSINGEEFDGDGTEFTFPVTYTAEADTGFNLVGNPFAATIDWDDGNWTKSNMDNTIYIWDASSNDYKDWNGFTGSLGDGLIPPFQGFWVKANSANPELTVNNSSKTVGGTFQSPVSGGREPVAMGLELEAGGLSKTTHISFTPGGRSDKDPMDAYRLLPFETDTYLELFTMFDDGSQLSINNRARAFANPISLPIYAGGFVDGDPISGEATLTWPKFKNVPEAWRITLVDNENGQEINLRERDFYSFSLSGTAAGDSTAQSQVVNSVSRFQLAEKSMSKRQNARFTLEIDPGSDAVDLPDDYELGINYPNPFSESTTIRFGTPEESVVRLHIYNILGQKVRTIVDKHYPAGYHEHTWDPTSLASGVYLYVMEAGGKLLSKKMTYIK